MAVEYVPVCVSRDSKGEALVAKYFVPPSGSSIDRVEDELNASGNIRYNQCRLPTKLFRQANGMARVEDTSIVAFATYECQGCSLNHACDQVSYEMLRRLP